MDLSLNLSFEKYSACWGGWGVSRGRVRIDGTRRHVDLDALKVDVALEEHV